MEFGLIRRWITDFNVVTRRIARIFRSNQMIDVHSSANLIDSFWTVDALGALGALDLRGKVYIRSGRALVAKSLTTRMFSEGNLALVTLMEHYARVQWAIRQKFS